MIFKKEHELVRKLAKSFAAKEITPIAAEVDKTARWNYIKKWERSASWE